MKKIRALFSSFQAKVTLVFIVALLFVTFLSNFFIYKFALDSQFNQLREKLMIIAQTAALAIDERELVKVPLDREGVKSHAYKAIVGKLMEIKKANPPIKYIYTMVRTDRRGVWQFVVDPDPVLREGRRKGVTAYPGDTYDASRFPEMLKGFEGPSADNKLVIDEWGVSLSGYAPIRDSDGRAVAVLGVDLAAEDVRQSQQEVHRRGLLVLIIGMVLSLGVGILISRRVTTPVKKLAEGTRRIAKGDLLYRVEVRGSDEVGELARSFNKMASSLLESRRKLHGYFYRVMQSFIRVLESRDKNMRGHSHRVAEYAKKIALEMGLSEEKAELVEGAARLHDIGKLGIRESILNKEGPLTPEEWEIIKEHPAISEDILKPAVIDREMLTIVRSHHERYDGIGYPDKINGRSISFCAQIIAVADAYDAMTSPRSYSQAMSREEAVEELRRTAGTQFNPRIVNAFLEII